MLGKKHLQRPCSVKLFFKWATFALQPQTQNYSNQKWNNLKLQEVMSVILKALFFTSKGHFRVSKTLVFKMRYLTSSWNRGQGELRKGLSISQEILLELQYLQTSFFSECSWKILYINLFNHLFVFWRVIIITFKRSYTVVICLLSLRWIVSRYKTYIVCSYFQSQRAKKVMFDSPGLVDFAF